jgi:hypothetical protein
MADGFKPLRSDVVEAHAYAQILRFEESNFFFSKFGFKLWILVFMGWFQKEKQLCILRHAIFDTVILKTNRLIFM